VTVPNPTTAPSAVWDLETGTLGSGTGIRQGLKRFAAGGAAGATDVFVGGQGTTFKEWLTADLTQSRSLTTSAVQVLGSVLIGSNYFVFQLLSGNNLRIERVPTSTFAIAATFPMDGFRDEQVGGCATDGTDIFICEANRATNVVRVHRYFSSLLLGGGGSNHFPDQSWDTTVELADTEDVRDMEIHDGKWWFLIHEGAVSTVRVCAEDGGSRSTADDFDGGGPAGGIAWDGTNFRVHQRGSGLYDINTYTNWVQDRAFDPTPNNVWCAYSFYNHTTGEESLELSPAFNAETSSRRRLTITSASIPAEATRVRFYVDQQTTEPEHLDWRRQGEEVDTDIVLTDFDEDGAHFPTYHEGSASLQAATTLEAEATHYKHGIADLQAVATMEATGNVIARTEANLQAASRFIIGTPTISNDPTVDFTKYDAYVDTTPFVYYEGAQAVTETQELTPTRSDVGANPDEIRPESGDVFGMSDFSGGAGQEFYHKPNRNPTAFYTSEGFDISRPGVMKHLWDAAKASTVTTSVGVLAQVQDLPFVADGVGVKRGDGAFPGTWTTEDPHVAEGNQTVLDLAASGNELYAALGVNGVHRRNAAGTWAHFQPDAATNLDVGTATLVAWAKDRLIAVGTAGTQIFEVTTDSTPSALKTLPTGWVFTDIFETGQFIYAPAINTNSGLSRIHIFGLASSGTTLEDRGSTPLPDGQLCYSGTGYLDAVFLGCGKRNASGGYDPLIYQATPAESGHLMLQKLAEEEGAGATNLSVGAVAPLGESVLFGWTQTSGASSGEAREGLAIFHLGRAAFANHIRKQAPAGTPQRIISITVYKGRILFSLEGDGLYYEDLDNYAPEAYIISSIADYFNAGSKTWSYLEQAYKPLPSGSSVTLDYTTKHPEDDTWAEALNDSTASSESAETSLSRTESRIFAVRLNSNALADQSDAPTILSFAIRSNPLPMAAEYNLVRYLRINPSDNKRKGEPFTQDPKLVRKNLQALAWHHVKFYEADATWNARIVGVADYETAQPLHETTTGEGPKESYVLRLTMRGTRDG
jgi:hypothetical protein